MSTRRLFRSKKVLLEDGMQEAGLLVGEDGKIDKVLKKDELRTQSSNVEVSLENIIQLIYLPIDKMSLYQGF